MPSAKKDRVTVSLHLDRRLYTLLKRCSLLEEMPMSRIVDDLLESQLAKYQYDSLERSEKEEENKIMYEAILEHEQEQDFGPDDIPVDEKVKELRRKIASLEEIEPSEKYPLEILEAWKAQLISKCTEAEKEALERLKAQRLEMMKRWKEACEKFPLP